MKLRVLAVLPFLAVPAVAQLVETIEVRVANVDVIVTDRSGNPVPGLKKATTSPSRTSPATSTPTTPSATSPGPAPASARSPSG